MTALWHGSNVLYDKERVWKGLYGCIELSNLVFPLQVLGSATGSPASSSTSSSSSRQYTRQRITRVNLRDLIFYMEQEREMAHSLLLYRALLK